ncbi:MAG: UvrD-helicase domain-containing protein, partial [Candidatus Gastranaerophilaceae bacterium]
MSNILTALNKEQQEAVTHENGPMLVLAGAGSGKTRVLITRIVHLIQNGCNPWNILAVTFTNKAAQEMKSRLESILGPEVVKNLWIGTFHSICGKILRQDIENYKTEDGMLWQKNFVIFDENDSLALIKNALKTLNIDEKVYPPKMIKAAISMAKNQMQNAYSFATKAKDYRNERISSIYNLYEEALAQNNALDFDDLLLMTANLLSQNMEILQKYHNKFKHILVDEFQDTNLTQYKLINAIYTAFKAPEELDKEKSLCVVGDIDQSIYSWRGADYKIILNFQFDFKDAKLIKLEQNYRSTGHILDAANSIIDNNIERISKNLYSNKGQGEKIKCY